MADDLFDQSGKTGSVVVIADTVSPAEISKINKKNRDVEVPVQILSVTALGTPPDRGLAEAANLLNAPVAKLSVDAADVESKHRKAKRQPKSVLAEKSGEHWKDNGYALVPAIVLISLMWARNGWTIKR